MKTLETIDQWNDVLELSSDHPVVIYKHSSTCPISAGAHERLNVLESSPVAEHIYKVVVQSARDVSNKIEEDLGVKHESPQIIIVSKKQAIYDESHHAILSEEVENEYGRAQED